MNHKKTILFLASWYPNKVLPTSGNFIEKHAQAVAAYFNIVVLHAYPIEQKEKFNIELTENKHITEFVVYYKKTLSNLPFISNLIKYKRLLAAYQYGFNQILKRYVKIDLVHLNVMYPAGLFALRLHKKYKLDYIITEHWTAFLKSDLFKFSLIEKYFIRKIGNKSVYICPVSNDLKNSLIDFGIKNKFEVIRNVVDDKVFSFNPKLSTEITMFLHISNFKDEQKNVSGLLNVIKKLSELQKDFIFTIAGDGDINVLIKQAENLEIPKGIIRFEGEKTTKEVAALMNSHDALVLFSHYENSPCVISEALITGTPVISTNVGGIPEMIDENNGLLVNDNDEEALLEKLIYFKKNKTTYNTKKIRASAIELYSKSIIGKMFKRIYDSLLVS